jgi:hypothetical protein
MWACKLLITKHFHGVLAGNQPPYLLKLRYGKVRSLLSSTHCPVAIQLLITVFLLTLWGLIFLALWRPGRTRQQNERVRQHRACAVQALCGVARDRSTVTLMTPSVRVCCEVLPGQRARQPVAVHICLASVEAERRMKRGGWARWPMLSLPAAREGVGEDEVGGGAGA